MKNYYLETNETIFCVGCRACVINCPTEALKMNTDNKGFEYPILDSTLCIECGECITVCPCEEKEKGYDPRELFAVQHRDEEVLQRSQSGGVFTLLSDIVLERKGACYGAIIDNDFQVKYARATTKEERNKMCESKYVQAIIEEHIFSQISKDLTNEKLVLFSGPPCYTYMAQKIWGNFKNFICIDFICHGVPSPKVWGDYIDLRIKELGNVKRVKFRNQEYLGKGWHSESLFTDKGEEYISNMYSGIFYSHLAHRDCCSSCHFAKEHRYSDLTMGGFLDDNPLNHKEKYGVSMLFVNSEKGKWIFDEALEKAKIEKCDKNKKYRNQPCLYTSINKEDKSQCFWEDYSKYSLDKLIKSYIGKETIEKYHIELERNSQDIFELIKVEG